MIPTEANYAEWFTCSVRYHLLRNGYAFLTFALDQVAEPDFPGGRLFAGGNRLVGLRFVLPVQPAPGAAVRSHRISEAALTDTADWMVLALPQFADPLDQQLTHNKVLFARPANVQRGSSGETQAITTLTFKQLMAGIEDGSLGREIPDGWTQAELLAAAAASPATLYLVVNPGARVIFGLGGQIERSTGHRKGVSNA